MAKTVIIDADDDSLYAPVDEGGPAVEITDSETPPGGDSKAAEEDEVEIETAPAKQVATEDDRFAAIEKENRELREALIKLSSRAEPKPAAAPATVEPKAEKVTKAQLAAVLNENRDADGNIRPDVLMNIVDHLVEERTNEAKVAAFQEFDQTNWKRQIASSSKVYMSGLQLTSQDQAEVNEFVRNLKLEDNPAAEMIGWAMLRLAKESQQQPTEPEKKESTKTVAKEVAKMDRTKAPVVNKPAAKKVQLTQDQLDMAKRFGVKPETYAKFVGR